MKSKIKIGIGITVVMAVLIAALKTVFVAQAADVVGTLPAPYVPIINSQNNLAPTATNGNFTPQTNQTWPGYITNTATFGTTLYYVTNVTALVTPTTGTSIALQFSAQQLTISPGTNNNILWQIGRSVPGGSPTNCNGANLSIEWFATISQALPTNASVGLFTTNLNIYNSQGGAYTTYYLNDIATSNTIILTNYQVWANSR